MLKKNKDKVSAKEKKKTEKAPRQVVIESTQTRSAALFSKKSLKTLPSASAAEIIPRPQCAWGTF